MSTSESILISSDGIKNSLKKYKSLKAVSEYVWNGFDAKATTISIELTLNELDSISTIIISDNGSGIDRDQLNNKFKPFFQSEKIYDPEVKHSATHGKNGVGRLTFFTFAILAEWKTIYKSDEKSYMYTITTNSDFLDRFEATPKVETTESTGTTVTLSNIIDPELTCESISEYLCKEFCWYLELHESEEFKILINGKPLNYNSIILEKEKQSFNDSEENFNFDVTFICWKHRLNEYSKYYYIKSNGDELAKENTTYNNKGDNFYHSVFIKSSLFDHFDIESDYEYQTLEHYTIKNKKSDEYQHIIRQVNKLLLDKRKPFLREHVSKVIETLDIKSAFPFYNEKNALDVFKKSQIEDMITSLYIAQPKIFSSSMNKEQKKTFIRLLDLIMESGEVDSLFNILQEILEMDTYEREELSEILKFTRMSNITKTIKLLKDRYQAVSDLKLLVYKDELKANEVKHVQKFIEKHYWLFGEQYNLVTAAEPNFTEALKRYTQYLFKEYEDKAVEHPDKLKQMDIFAVRQDFANGIVNNIVVELKHPNVPLGETQLSQVKKYMEVILSIDQFNASNMKWEFYLVGNRFNNNGYIQREIENNKHHGEKSLVFNVDNYKIYVKTWSEIFADFELRYDHLTKVLDIEHDKLQKEYASADEVIESQTASTAKMCPEMLKA